MNFIKTLLDSLKDYFSKQANQELKTCRVSLEQANSSLQKLQHKIVLLTDERDAYFKQVNNLKAALSDANIKITQLEASQQDNYDTNPIIKFLDEHYHRVILEYTKRWVLSLKNKKETIMFEDFIRPLKIFKWVFSNYKLSQIWNYPIEYVSDNYEYNGCLDVWQYPEETYTLGKGDCEDSTAFRVSVAKALGFEKSGVKFFMAVGLYIRDDGSSSGHAFPIMIVDPQHWFVLEATSNIFEKIEYPNKHYKIGFLTDGVNTWEVDNKLSGGGVVLKTFDLKKA